MEMEVLEIGLDEEEGAVAVGKEVGKMLVVGEEDASAEVDAQWGCARIDCCCLLHVSEQRGECSGDLLIFWSGTAVVREEDAANGDGGSRRAKAET